MIQEIIDNIYIGDWQDAVRFEREFSDIFTVAFDSQYKGNHFYPLLDGPYSDNELTLIYAIYDLIETRRKLNNKEKILVHCIAGISRSPAVIIGYMMIVYGYDVDDALSYVKRIRVMANPVPELMILLKNNCTQKLSPIDQL